MEREREGLGLGLHEFNGQGMKYLFLGSFVALMAASGVTYLLQPDVRSQAPVLYWVTDANPARAEQVERFRHWLEKNNYPRMELRLDTANNATSKKIIQGVSGVGGDVIDSFGGSALRQLHAVGLLADVTEPAKELGFDPGHTYPAIVSQIAVNDRQYAFPCNAYTTMFWVNKATFAKYGLPAPPKRWDFETFEQFGRQFVGAANPPGKRRTAFFAASVDRDIMRCSLGLSVFNETLTRCRLDDPLKAGRRNNRQAMNESPAVEHRKFPRKPSGQNNISVALS